MKLPGILRSLQSFDPGVFHRARVQVLLGGCLWIATVPPLFALGAEGYLGGQDSKLFMAMVGLLSGLVGLFVLIVRVLDAMVQRISARLPQQPPQQREQKPEPRPEPRPPLSPGVETQNAAFAIRAFDVLHERVKSVEGEMKQLDQKIDGVDRNVTRVGGEVASLTDAVKALAGVLGEKINGLPGGKT